MMESSTRVERTESNLLRRIAGFVAALVVITLVSHLLGGAAGRWWDRQSSVSAATRSE